MEQREEDRLTDNEIDLQATRAQFIAAEDERAASEVQHEQQNTCLLVLVYVMALVLAGIVLIAIGVLR